MRDLKKNKLAFGVSTWLWQSPFSTESIGLFPKIKKMGFDVVEIPIENPLLINATEVKKALDDHGLKASICGAFGPTKDLTSKDEKVHLHCFKYLEQCFEICNELGAASFVGPLYSAVGKARMIPTDQRKAEWDLAVANLKHACHLAYAYDLKIGIEPLNRFESDMVNTAEDVMQLIADVDHEAAMVSLDSFHMTIEENNLRKAINKVGNKLIHIQVSENHRGIPGTGLTPWNDIYLGLKDINYNGAMVIESFTPEIKELAGAVCIWKTKAKSQDEFAQNGLEFLRRTFKD
ncbi:sugar phosphate isomerase/epimerase family protein [Maribacter dokdonensis]|uniref:sugar phosphate isomerase/epimerase family protein n=1 Tax=Maribacter dokdonensis TaxID=320912 RepID=UPI00329A55B4